MANNLSLERTGMVTGSRIAGILGLSPYRKRSDVMREMVREAFFFDAEFDGNFITEFGSEHEIDGVVEYELLNGVQTAANGENQVTLVDRESRIAVTPDFLVPDDGAGEVKCPWRAKYSTWKERPDYEQQCRLVAKVLQERGQLEGGWMDFVVWRTEGTNISRMFVDVDRDGEKFDWWGSVKDPLARFIDEYDAIVDQGADSDAVRKFTDVPDGYRQDPEYLAAVATYLELKAEEDRLALYRLDAQRELERLVGDQSAKGGGLHVIYRRPSAGGQGAVSYKKALETLAPQVVEHPELLDQFRGKPTAASNRGTYAYKLISEDTK